MQDYKFSEWLPKHDSHVHKYSRGRVAIIGGSDKFPGAAMLAAKSAARAGAGYVTAFVPDVIHKQFQVALPEIVSCALPSTEDGFIGKCASTHIDLTKQHCALYGPGTGNGKTQEKLLKKLLQADIPLVVDADMIIGLTQLEKEQGAKPLYKRSKTLVITPHHGELKKWLRDITNDDYNELEDIEIVSRVQSKLNDIEATNLVVVAKGERTLVITANQVLEPIPGTETLATAGTGDVLAGTIAGLISQTRPFDVTATANVCAAAVEVHGIAGQLAASKFGRRGVIASDVCENLGLAVDMLSKD